MDQNDAIMITVVGFSLLMIACLFLKDLLVYGKVFFKPEPIKAETYDYAYDRKVEEMHNALISGNDDKAFSLMRDLGIIEDEKELVFPTITT